MGGLPALIGLVIFSIEPKGVDAVQFTIPFRCIPVCFFAQWPICMKLVFLCNTSHVHLYRAVNSVVIY